MPADTVSKVSSRREIPYLPKSLDELVNLWREGSEKKGFRPVHQYKTARNRKLIMKNYSDLGWKKSGQKYAYLRFQRVILGIASYNDGLTDIFCRGSDEKWNISLSKLMEAMGIRSKNSVPVSSVEKLTKQKK